MRRQLLALSVLAVTAVQGVEDVEPPIGFSLQVGDAKIRLEPGKAKTLKGKFEDPSVKLVPDDFRIFSYGGVHFKYPSGFGFEADMTTPDVKLWTLDGNDSVIMLQYYVGVELSAKEMADQLIGFYGAAAKGEPKKIGHRYNGKEYSGFRVTAEIAGAVIFQDVLAIPTKDGSRILVIQDLPAAEKVSEKEAKLVSKFLNETLTVGEAPEEK
ncbi:hypothetical protein [Haloferula sp.]|uniref:hypothetical protein n=1 Tax=Haloferula sp. TaxID=2497595 RepID=UPI00329B62B1